MSTPTLKVQRVHPDAIVPAKAHETDAGYDLTAIALHKQVNSVVALYDTGLKVVIDPGYYIEIVPRSSIIKSGYMLANSIGIIDNDYRGNLYVALAKIAPEAPPLTLPSKAFQLIIRKQYDAASVVEVNDIDVTETVRGTGGFGSTDKK